MELKKREEVIKDLQEIVDNYSGSWKRYDVIANALALIKELADENERLKKDNEYILMQHAFQRRPSGDCWNDVIEKAKVDTIKRMQERLQEEFAKIMIIRGVENDDPNMDSDDVWDALALVTKEMLED